jgi:hypothetical protein
MERGAAVKSRRHRHSRCWLALLAVCASAGTAADQLVLVTGRGSPITRIEPLEVRKLFVGLSAQADGRPLRAIHNESDGTLRPYFLQHVVALSGSSYERRRLELTLQQGRQRPQEVRTLDELVQALGRDGQAVSYMWRSTAERTGQLKVLRVLWAE